MKCRTDDGTKSDHVTKVTLQTATVAMTTKDKGEIVAQCHRGNTAEQQQKTEKRESADHGFKDKAKVATVVKGAQQLDAVAPALWVSP